MINARGVIQVYANNFFDGTVHWTLPEMHLQIGEFVGRTLCNALNRTVFQITDKAGKGKVVGMVKNKPAEADALYLTFNDVLNSCHVMIYDEQDLRKPGR